MNKEEIKERIKSIEEKIPFPRPVIMVFLTAFIIRIAFWLILPPTWKMHAAVYSLDKSFLEYCGDFIGYKAGRPPFIDFVMGRTYLITKSFLGTKGLTLFPTALSIISLPFGYEFVRKVFDEKVAFYSLIFLAFYPKLVYIAARGLPEASSLALVIISLYFLKRGSEDGNIYFLVSGMLASLAYLFYLPTILFIGVTSLFLIFRNRRKIIDGLKQSFYFFILPALAFCLHWLKGPFKEVLFENASAGGIRESIFIKPEAYSILEKAGRYVLYSFFDFWWHYRGFDHEGPILKRYDLLESAIPLFNVAAVVWFAGGIVLTIAVIYSFKELRDKELDADWFLFVASTFVLYWVWWWYKAIFRHGLQTRHIFPQIAFMAVLFGVGVVKIKEYSPKLKKIYPLLCYLSLFVLVLTALGHGFMYNRLFSTAYNEPMEFLEEKEGKIAVLSGHDYRRVKSVSPNSDITFILRNASQERESMMELINYLEIDEPNVERLRENNFQYVLISDFFVGRSDFSKDLTESLESDGMIIYNRSYKGASSRIYEIT